MQVIGRDTVQDRVIVVFTTDEWDRLVVLRQSGAVPAKLNILNRIEEAPAMLRRMADEVEALQAEITP